MSPGSFQLHVVVDAGGGAAAAADDGTDVRRVRWKKSVEERRNLMNCAVGSK